MSKVAYAVEHAGCLPGTTCLVRKVLNAEKAKDMAPLWMVQLLMRIENIPGQFKVHHDCDAQGCPYKITGKHVCSFGCNRETKLKSNMSIHENGQHAGLRTHCEKAGCRFIWTDLAAYSKHKKRVHGLPPVPHKMRNLVAVNKRRSQTAARRVESRENSVLSEASWYYSSNSPTSPSSTPMFDQPSSLLGPDVFSSNLWPPSTDFGSASIGPSNKQLHGEVTLSQPVSSCRLSSAAPHHEFVGASGSSYLPPAVNTSLAHWPFNDGDHGVYEPLCSQTSTGSSSASGNQSLDLSSYSESSTMPAFWDPILGSNEHSTASEHSYGSGSYWPALEELLATSLSDVSFDPTLETTLQPGYLNNQPDASAVGSWYSGVPM